MLLEREQGAAFPVPPYRKRRIPLLQIRDRDAIDTFNDELAVSLGTLAVDSRNCGVALEL